MFRETLQRELKECKTCLTMKDSKHSECILKKEDETVIWTVMNGLVSGYTLEFAGSDGASRGRVCVVADIVRTSPAAVRRARENSLSVKGAKMFNLLPPYLRNIF